MFDEIEDSIQEMLPDGWEYQGGFGLSGLLTCPCGIDIEQDGQCPNGCVSPLRALGLV